MLLLEKIKSLLSFCRAIHFDSYNRESDEVDVSLARNIIAFFKSTDFDQRGDIGRWENEAQKRRKALRLIKNEEPIGLSYELANLFRRPLVSTVTKSIRGHDLHRWGMRDNWKVVKEAYQAAHTLKTLQKQTDLDLDDFFTPPTAGNPYTVSLDGRPVLSSTLHHVGHLCAIRSYFSEQKDKTPVFCDIGSGIGEFAFNLRKAYPSAKIISVDLPEILFVAYYLLAKEFPNSSACFLKPGESIVDALESHDSIFLTNTQVSALEHIKVDVFTNMTSMNDMPESVVRDYLQLIRSTLTEDGFFYCFNGETPQACLGNKSLTEIITDVWGPAPLKSETIHWMTIMRRASEISRIYYPSPKNYASFTKS